MLDPRVEVGDGRAYGFRQAFEQGGPTGVVVGDDDWRLRRYRPVQDLVDRRIRVGDLDEEVLLDRDQPARVGRQPADEQSPILDGGKKFMSIAFRKRT